MNMIKQLHRRLTALYTVTTGLILTAVIIGVLAVGTREFQKKNLETFQNNLLTITSRLQSGGTVDCTWLARMENGGKLIIHIEDSGQPLLFRGSWKPPTERAALIGRAKMQAEKESVFTSVRPISASLVRSSVFTVTGDHRDSYYGSVLVIPSPKGFQSLILLAWQDPADAGIYRQRFLFLFLDIAGIAALYLVCRVLVGRSLKPIEESREKQNEFIAAASHELRSPLCVIRSSLTAVTAAPEKSGQFLANIDRECTRMSGLVSDLLLLASADAKSWTLNKEALDMDTLMISMYERFEPLYEEKGVGLRLNLPEDSLPCVTGDKSRLEQVLSVLLDNALAYTPAGKQVELSAAVRGDRQGGRTAPRAALCRLTEHFLPRAKKRSLQLTVSDQGCGIPDEAKKHVFDRFYRADASRTERQHYGLGLSIARELVQLHGGTISVCDSESGGACFCIELYL